MRGDKFADQKLAYGNIHPMDTDRQNDPDSTKRTDSRKKWEVPKVMELGMAEVRSGQNTPEPNPGSTGLS